MTNEEDIQPTKKQLGKIADLIQDELEKAKASGDMRKVQELVDQLQRISKLRLSCA